MISVPEPLITIVDENDIPIGAETRALTRKQGLRHRIVRIFLVNAAGQILLQQRSLTVHDKPGKWDQSVGGHVDADESYEQAAFREAREELGIELTELHSAGVFYTERHAEDGVIRRFQTVYVARYDGPLQPSPAEVAKTQWVSPAEIEAWHQARPDDFTGNFYRSYAIIKDMVHNLSHEISKEP